MRSLLVKPAPSLRGEITLSGDKSIAHRFIIISAISRGKTTIKNFPANQDCLYTTGAFKKLDIKISRALRTQNKTITVSGKGLYGLKKPKGSIFVGDSGTTLRLLLGILAGQNFAVKLTAGKSLSKRPMRRVIIPLRMMGAKVNGQTGKRANGQREEYPPITIRGGNLKPIVYRMPVASAQVKSAILLAGLYTDGTTKIIEPIKTRDHTERMLKLFKADIKVKENTIVIKGNRELVSPGRVSIPADISSAGFFIVLTIILPNSRLRIKNVSLNPSRIGIIKVLKRMGADIKVSKRQGARASALEPAGDLIVENSRLKGTTVKKEEIPSLIDELPILMVAACYAHGRTVFEGAGELRVKETDRIRSMSYNLRKMGADIRVISATNPATKHGGFANSYGERGGSAKNFGGKTAESEKIIIRGLGELKGARVRSFGDHRTAMSMVVAGLKARGKTRIDDVTCINKSFPDFLSILKTLIQ